MSAVIPGSYGKVTVDPKLKARDPLSQADNVNDAMFYAKSTLQELRDDHEARYGMLLLVWHYLKTQTEELTVTIVLDKMIGELESVQKFMRLEALLAQIEQTIAPKH